MSTAYGSSLTRLDIGLLSTALPLQLPLADGSTLTVNILTADNKEAFAIVHKAMNAVIQDGRTYPQREELNEEGFRDYFCGGVGFFGQTSDGVTIGGFYVKPNFPGRSSHICNGGFVICPEFRGKGYGGALADAFVQVAPLLGFKASVFNLVYANNTASVRLWQRKGFQQIGIVPEGGRLRVEGKENKEEYVDALVFYMEFANNALSKRALEQFTVSGLTS